MVIDSSGAFTAVMFWVVTPCSIVVGYRRFGGPCSLQVQVEVKMEVAWTSEALVSCRNITRASQLRRPLLVNASFRSPVVRYFITLITLRVIFAEASRAFQQPCRILAVLLPVRQRVLFVPL
jgi:hypothetical protein